MKKAILAIILLAMFSTAFAQVSITKTGISPTTYNKASPGEGITITVSVYNNSTENASVEVSATIDSTKNTKTATIDVPADFVSHNAELKFSAAELAGIPPSSQKIIIEVKEGGKTMQKYSEYLNIASISEKVIPDNSPLLAIAAMLIALTICLKTRKH